jgi:5-methylcytosine-specific restriction enzyme subunit McrC
VRTVTLTERRTAVRRLPWADADDLTHHFRHVVDVTPTFDRGVYRLTARGYVGTFRTANFRWEVRPKLPWDALRWLAGFRTEQSEADRGPGSPGCLADLLAGRLADLMRERAEAGLIHDYAERETEEAAVRGRIDLPRQLRERTPDLFHLITDEFTPDVLWNRLPKSAARHLLDHAGLSVEARGRLSNVLSDYAAVSDRVPMADELDRLRYDARTEPYRPLIDFSRLVLGHGGPPIPAGGSALLVNLEHLFQYHVGQLLSRSGTMRPGWSVERQAAVALSPAGSVAEPLTLRPDLLVRDPAGRPVAVWDAKWKPLGRRGPEPGDVHQVLAYASALGLQTAGLVYPGRRFAVASYSAPGSAVTLRVVRLRLLGPSERRERSADRFGRLVFRHRCQPVGRRTDAP